ncbi:MAG: hypothetical protein RL745_77 [Actinomycetota bacterium]
MARRLSNVAATPQTAIASPATAATSNRVEGRRVTAAYLALTKPRIIELLLVTTVPVMFAAAGGLPSLPTVIWTVLGGTLAAAGANVFNCLLDADIDAHMQRTANRPTVTGDIGRKQALVFAISLSTASVLVLWWGANQLSAILAAAAIASYVVGYTMLLKRRTAQNIVWGGIAGCFPVLIGWTAVSGRPSLAAWLLFALVFFWTPAHYWPLSVKYREDYRAAHVPMLGAIADPSKVARSVLAYVAATTVTAIGYGLVADTGMMYWLVSSAAAVWFTLEGIGLWRSCREIGASIDVIAARSMRVFHVSISYLALVFLAVGVDPFVSR